MVFVMNRFLPLSIIVSVALWAVSCGDNPGGKELPDYSMSYTVKGVTFEMLKAPAGNLTMGISADNRRKVTHGIAQPVALDGFVISSQPVSQALWTAVMGNNPSQVKDPSAPAVWPVFFRFRQCTPSSIR